MKVLARADGLCSEEPLRRVLALQEPDVRLSEPARVSWAAEMLTGKKGLWAVGCSVPRDKTGDLQRGNCRVEEF